MICRNVRQSAGALIAFVLHPRPQFIKPEKLYAIPSITYGPRAQNPASPHATPLVMASPAQITANRANAQRSTGPRSAEGKSASSMNALKHGLDAETTVIPGEDPAAYQALVAAYAEDYQPENCTEEFLVDTMLRADWQKRRAQLVEADVTRILLAETPGQSLAAALLSNTPAARLLTRVQRQLAALDRTWFRAHQQIFRIRKLEADNRDDMLLGQLFGPDLLDGLGSLPELPKPAPQPSKSAKAWPPIDEKTGQPAFFVG